MNSRQSTDKPRYGPAVAIAAMIFGILWLVVFHPESPRSGTVIAQGTVVDQDITRKGLCAPIAELQVNNASYTVKSGISAEPCDYAIGDAIEVSYHPEDIAGTLEAPPAGTSYPVVLAPVPGVLFLAAGAISLIRRVAAASKAGMTRR
ncbi:MAG: hypothetical protein ABWY04_01875 [Arthrobacter sp.]